MNPAMSPSVSPSVSPSLPKPLLLSAAWSFLLFNYLYADVMGLMDARLLQQYLTGTVNGLRINDQMLLAAAFLMEVPIAMVVLSLVLPVRAVRLTNMAAGTLKTVVVFATLFVGDVKVYYFFFAVIEIAVSAGVVVVAARWRPVTAQ